MWSPQTSKFGDGISRKASELYSSIQNKKVKHFETNKQTHPAPGFCPHITNHCKILKSIQIIKKCSCARVFRQCPYLLRILRIWGNALHLSLFLFCTNQKQLCTILQKNYNLHEKKHKTAKKNIRLLKIDIKNLKTHENIKKHKKNTETHRNT